MLKIGMVIKFNCYPQKGNKIGIILSLNDFWVTMGELNPRVDSNYITYRYSWGKYNKRINSYFEIMK